ncbi:MAG TPA: cytochrome c [Vicinamibacterales bacterium]|nr:cytochrome c [Vicinamibacterales bacterium]
MKAPVAILLAALATTIVLAQQPPQRFGIGRPATDAEIKAEDIDIGPDGAGLPAGKGSAAEGATVYAAKCAQCHGKTGKEGPNDVLVGRGAFPSGADTTSRRTIGNYWPYATTVFDYIRRAMPSPAPGTLKDDEVYALAAFLLAENEIIPRDAVLDAATLRKVVMPARDKFVADSRNEKRKKQ